MEVNEKYMQRCIQLAGLGAGDVAPNPMVGSVIVYEGKIIGEGFHRKYGGPHAEVNAIKSVSDPEMLKKSTLYVSLEPCAHHGLTPPCSDLIIEKKIPEVVIGTIDPFSEVAGKGIEKLEKAGVKVTSGILEKECRELNKRFFTFHERKRPFVILKWAQTIDGFIDADRSPESFGEPTWITGDLALQLVHKIRSEESAILVGTNTAQKDNPSLTVRHWPGKNPIRLVLDRNLRLSTSLHLFNDSEKTLVFNFKKCETNGQVSYVKIESEKELLPQIMDQLYRRNILSVIVEGGMQLLAGFFDAGCWDEAHVFIGDTCFYEGIRAPQIKGKLVASEILGKDQLKIFMNPFQK
jgi:diaminohydroxyphosphoribosylaminopyrimidine deaminase/5-amino-6-(5-phosphoribosylamino)uracil reductase